MSQKSIWLKQTRIMIYNWFPIRYILFQPTGTPYFLCLLYMNKLQYPFMGFVKLHWYDGLDVSKTNCIQA